MILIRSALAQFGAVALLLICAHEATAATYDVGPGKPYARLSNLPALAPGDLIQVYSGTYNEVKRWIQSGTASARITIRGVGATRPIFNATGLTVNGAMPNPRAIFQIEGSFITIENIEFINARNGNNAAGIRVTTGGNSAIVRNCKITYCDMGMMSDNSDDLLIESSEIAFNGTASFAGGSHNLYLSGKKVTMRYCYIHDSLYGQNFKSRGHYTELLYNYIADSIDGEVGLVDSTQTTTAESNALMVGNILISKDRGSAWNGVRFIQYGQDLGNSHTGTLYAFNNTFIAGTSRIIFFSANATGASVVARNNILYGSANVASGPISGSNNWAQSGAAVPAGLTSTTLGSSPGFVNLGARDLRLTSGSSCVNIGTSSLTYRDGSGVSLSGGPTREYVNHLQSAGRPTSGALDAGAYEFAAAATPPSITSHPSNRTVTAGQTAAFSVIASGTAPLSYQWQRNGANISGATSANYTTSPTTTADNGALFRCVVSNSAGSATSNNATLTVNAAAVAPTITSQPANQVVVAGQTATFNVAANGTAPLSYQWQKNSANISGANSASYTTPATSTGDNGSLFRCVVSNSSGSATSTQATLTVNSPSGGTGTGLTAEYFDNMDFTGTRIVRTDATVNFDWGSGAPNSSMGSDTFSVRWNGQVQAGFSEAITFYTVSDDGVRLWVNNQLVIDNWTLHAPTENASAPVTLSAGVKYSIKMEFFENGGGAVAKLLWSSASQPKQVIPQSQLYSSGTGTGLAAEYFDNIDFSGTRVVRTDSTVNFDWGSGSPNTSIAADTFSVRWTGEVQPKNSEAVTFYTVSDDGVRLWVNGQLVINNWTDHGPTENASAPVTLNAGIRYAIKMEFYENGGGAVAKLLWSSASVAKEIVPAAQLYPAVVAATTLAMTKSIAPVEDAESTSSPLTSTTEATAGVPVQFSFTNAVGAACSWDFGDGSTLSGGSSIEHTYTTAGTFTVVVTSEVDGVILTNTQTINVSEAAAPMGELLILKLSGKLTKNQNSGTVTFSGFIPELSLQAIEQSVDVRIGTAKATFDLDKKGKRKNDIGTLQLKLRKNGPVSVRGSMKSVELAGASSIDVNISLDGKHFGATAPLKISGQGNVFRLDTKR